MLALYLLLSITGTHYTQTYVGIIRGSLFVEVLDHPLIQQQYFAMHALSCDLQITTDCTTIA